MAGTPTRQSASLEQTRLLYSRRAGFYETFFTGFLNWNRLLMEFFQRHELVLSGSRILDAGCGTGAVSKAIWITSEERGYERVSIQAFDLSDTMLAVFQAWVDDQRARNVELLKADVLSLDTQLPSGWKGYDLVVASTLIEHITQEDITRAFSQLARLLRPGGRLLLMVTRRNLLTRMLATAWWKANTYSALEIEAKLQAEGLRGKQLPGLRAPWNKFIMVIEAEKTG